MRNFTFKGLLLTAVFALLGCLSIQAADDDLITKQITIKLDKAGTLPDRIASSKKYKITNLKIVGEVNGTDLKFIREMAGCDFNGKETDGKLSICVGYNSNTGAAIYMDPELACMYSVNAGYFLQDYNIVLTGIK